MSELLPFTVDLTTLLVPISAREPAGEWLRYEGTYDAVQEARREDDESLPKGIWLTKVKRADWAKVDALCQKALRERTKDLQLAAWLTEAWLQLYGLPGFAGGLLLCSALLRNFWETLYPLLDEADTAYRLAPLEFLERKVAQRLKLVPLTDSPQTPGEERPPLSFADWEQALHNEKHLQDKNGVELVPALFLASAAATPPQKFARLHAELLAIEQAALAVEAVIAEHTKEQYSVLRGLRGLVTDILVLIAQYTPTSPEAEPGGNPGATPAPGTASKSPGSDSAGADQLDAADKVRPRPGGDGGPIKNRHDAYQRLSEAADYLLRTEPHSPVPYLVKRAVSWGNMNLMQLLSELVNSDADRVAIYALLGIKAPP